MLTFYKASVTFQCPACSKVSKVQSVMALKVPNPNEVAQAAATLPLKCAICKELAPKGTNIQVHVDRISAGEYAEWIQENQTSLHTHVDRSTQQ